MSQHEIAITKAATLAAPAAAGSAASVTLAAAGGDAYAWLGMSAEQWAIAASVATFAYSGVLFVLALPRLGRMVTGYLRRWFPRLFPAAGEDDDVAGA